LPTFTTPLHLFGTHHELQEQTLNIDKNWGGSVLVADGPAQDISWGKGRVTVEAMSATPSDRSKKPADAFRLGPHATTLKAVFEKAKERNYKISNYDSRDPAQRPMLVQAVVRGCSVCDAPRPAPAPTRQHALVFGALP
jgi:cellobiose-specific phosphotransferase system component IIB